MIETVVTIPRGSELTMAMLGACCGVVFARLGGFGVALAGPMFALVGVVAMGELVRRELPSALLSYWAATAAAAWVLW